MGINWMHVFLSLYPYILIYLLTGGLGVFLLRRYRQRKAIDDIIRNTGLRTTAYISRSKEGMLTNDIIYTYKCEEKYYGQLQHISRKAVRNIHEGDSVIVCYLQKNPEKAILAEIDVWYLDGRFAYMLFFSMIAFIVLTVLFSLLMVIAISIFHY